MEFFGIRATSEIVQKVSIHPHYCISETAKLGLCSTPPRPGLRGASDPVRTRGWREDVCAGGSFNVPVCGRCLAAQVVDRTSFHAMQGTEERKVRKVCHGNLKGGTQFWGCLLVSMAPAQDPWQLSRFRCSPLTCRLRLC